LELGVVAHTCDPEALRRWRQEDFEFEVSLSCFFLEKNKKGI
jgi:hypothetical protein